MFHGIQHFSGFHLKLSNYLIYLILILEIKYNESKFSDSISPFVQFSHTAIVASGKNCIKLKFFFVKMILWIMGVY